MPEKPPTFNINILIDVHLVSSPLSSAEPRFFSFKYSFSTEPTKSLLNTPIPQKPTMPAQPIANPIKRILRHTR